MVLTWCARAGSVLALFNQLAHSRVSQLLARNRVNRLLSHRKENLAKNGKGKIQVHSHLKQRSNNAKYTGENRCYEGFIRQR
jgi:hypothetical protein